jgi:glutathionylspermidine synthase
MQRLGILPRTDWQDTAKRYGFQFHTMDGQTYWDESAYYAFSLEEIERDLEAPTEELHAMAMDLVGDVVASESMMTRLAIPKPFWDWIASSWRDRQPHVYGRMDLAYNGSGPAKLYELNYDTPTALYEASFFQWVWLEEQKSRGGLPVGADQFNSIQEKLVLAFGTIAKQLLQPMYFAAMRDSLEDQGTIAYLHDCATQCGLQASRIAIEDIGLSNTGEFTDLDNRTIRTLFKLYPLEQLIEDEFGKNLPASGLQLIEPPWKIILSKGILPLMWERHPDHPNLLPAFFDDANPLALLPGWVRKPVYSREGANIEMVLPDGQHVSSDGTYANGPTIRQACQPLPQFDGGYPLIGSWVIGDQAAGIGIREDASLITQNTSRFVPHVIL